MGLWLFKQEPSCYSFSNLQRDGSTTWDGVTNALAQKHLRSVKAGDLVLYYHTGDEKAVVGVMRVSSDPQLDPEDEAGKRVVVTVTPVRALAKTVTLASIKAQKRFADWELVRMPRLSIMPVPEELWNLIEEMASTK